MNGKQISDFLNNRDKYQAMKDIMLSQSSDTNANLNNKAKLILELPEYHKCLNLHPEWCRWSLATFLSIITTPFLLNRQTKVFELHQYCFLWFGVVFVGFFSCSHFLKNNKYWHLETFAVVLESLISLTDLIQSSFTYFHWYLVIVLHLSLMQELGSLHLLNLTFTHSHSEP